MKQNDYLVKAVNLLKPNSEFSLENNDYATIKWDILEGEAPTQTEIDSAIKQIKADEVEAEITQATKKQAAEAKLVALGLTLDDLKALGLG